MMNGDTQAESVLFRGWVRDVGGGVVVLLVDRDTVYYPEPGTHVEVRLIDGSSAP